MNKKVVYPILGLFIGLIVWAVLYGGTTSENSVVEDAAIGMITILGLLGAFLGLLISYVKK